MLNDSKILIPDEPTAGLVIPPYIFMPVFALIVSAVTIPFSYTGFSRQKIS